MSSATAMATTASTTYSMMVLLVEFFLRPSPAGSAPASWVLFISLLIRRAGVYQSARRRENGQYVASPSPTIAVRGTVPQSRLSSLSVRLSPITKYCPAGTRNGSRQRPGIVQGAARDRRLRDGGIEAPGGPVDVGLRHLAAVHEQAPVLDLEHVAGHADDPLDEDHGRILGVVEDDRRRRGAGRAGGRRPG